jgi:hypothetical protein
MNLAAVITESRNCPRINNVIKKHLEKLPEYTKLYFFGSKENQKRIKFKHTFYEVEINSIEDYCYWIASQEFWNLINEENVLIFQTDSMIIGGNIEQFYEYDYIGSPLKSEADYVYNGGLSFRHKTVMLDIITKWNYNRTIHENEDGYFSRKVYEHYKKTPKQIAEKFSVDNIFKLGTFGYHAIERSLTKEQVKQIKSQI